MNYEKQDMYGALRSGLLQLKRASLFSEESWDEEEVMLNPRECVELNGLIRDYKSELKRVETVSKKFCVIADSRMV